MRPSTQLISLATLASCCLLADGAAAQAYRSFQTERHAGLHYDGIVGCESTKITVSHTSYYTSWAEEPEGGHVQLQLEYRNTCVQGAFIVQTLTFVALKPPSAFGENLESASLSVQGQATDRYCSQSGSISFRCVRTQKPVQLQIAWQGSGDLVRDVRVNNVKEEVGTHYIERVVELQRPAVATVTGELAGHTLDIEVPSSLSRTDRWYVSPPLHVKTPEPTLEEQPLEPAVEDVNTP